MFGLNTNVTNGWLARYRLPGFIQPARLWTDAKDTVAFGYSRRKSNFDTPTYPPKLEIGTYSPPRNYPFYDIFDPVGREKPNPPGIAKVEKIVSLDPTESDPKQAYASEVTVNLKGTRLYGKTVPGEHLTVLDISNPKVADDSFKEAMKEQGSAYQFTPRDLQCLGTAKVGNFTIASPMGGERGAMGKPNGKIKLIVRRVEQEVVQDGVKKRVKGPLTNYIVSRKPGDALVFAAPISHLFVGPTAKTPAAFFGVGSSVAPYVSMLRTRFEQEAGPYADTYLAIGHTRSGLEYYGKIFRKFARNKNNHFTYRAVYSRESSKSNGVAYVQNLIQQEEEAEKIFKLILNPKAHIYVSGFVATETQPGFAEQILEALKKSAQKNSRLNVTPEQIEAAFIKATAEQRFHMEGDVRQDLAEGVQGY